MKASFISSFASDTKLWQPSENSVIVNVDQRSSTSPNLIWFRRYLLCNWQIRIAECQRINLFGIQKISNPRCHFFLEPCELNTFAGDMIDIIDMIYIWARPQNVTETDPILIKIPLNPFTVHGFWVIFHFECDPGFIMHFVTSLVAFHRTYITIPLLLPCILRFVLITISSECTL